MKRYLLFFIFHSFIFHFLSAQPHAAGYVRPHSEVEANKPTTDVAVKTGAYTADWNNLAAWECPEWFRDAKFGIWAHWDPQCEAEDGDWYARSMYGSGNQRTTFYNYFGHYPNHDWGYKDFCRYWTIANWNPAALIDLYYAAGARYFMAMGQHHDNYDCWDSPYQEWNSMNIGPKRDVVGEWAAECRRVGMKLGVSMHGAHAWTFFEVGRDADTGVTKDEGDGKWWQGYDPQELYAQNHDHSSNWSDWGTIHNQWDWGNGVCPPSIAYMQKFQNRILQCINKYDPDMLYFDDTVLPFYGASTNTNDQYSLRILQHFYNHSAAKNGGQQDVVVCGKKLNDTHKKAMLWDIERGTPDRCQDLPWQTCTCLGGWHYSKYEGDRNMYKSAETVIRMLVDIVSKNGNLLLSVPVRGDGTIDNNERNIVNGIKAWMDINSESVHGTRPWKVFGEGPAAEATYGMNNQGFNEGQSYGSSDVRYVTKNGKIYATIMAWPSAGDYRFKAFGITSQFYSGTVTSVKLLGAGDVPFTFDGSGLVVTVPSTKPNSIAPVFEITLGETSPFETLRTLTGYMESQTATWDAMVGTSTGKYTQASVDALKVKLAEAKALASSADEATVEAAMTELRKAFDGLEDNKVAGGNLYVIGTNLTTEKLVEASNFSRSDGQSTRFGTPANWTVENFTVNNPNGTKNGIDNYPGQNCLMLGLWSGEDGSTSSDLTNARIYRKVMLPAGHYFFAAAYNANYQLANDAYIFASTALTETAEIPEKSIAYYRINESATDGNYYGIEFFLDKDEEMYLGWQVNLSAGAAQEEFRVTRVELIDIRQEGIDQGVLTAPWTQCLTAVPAENIGNYFFVLKDYPQPLFMVAKNGNHQGSGNKTMWYTANVDPSKNKDALWTFDSDGEYQIITSATYPDVMLQTNGAWNYQTGDNGGGDLSWGRAKFELTDYGWTIQNGRYGGTNYLGRWDGEDEVAFNRSDAGHYDLFSIPRGLYVKSFEDVASASAEHPVDITYIISNPGAERYADNKVYSWTNGSEWNAEGNGLFDGLVGSRYFEFKTKADGDAATVASDIYQEFTDLPAGFYRFSAVALGGQGLVLYANDASATAPTGSASRISVIGEVTTDGILRVGARAYHIYEDWVKFDDVKLEYLYAVAPQTVIGTPAWNKAEGGYVQAFYGDLTVSFNEASSAVPGATFALLSTTATLSDGTDTLAGTLSLTDKTVCFNFPDFTLGKGKDYTVTLPANSVGYAGLQTNDEITFTFHTPYVFDGTYYLMNVGTGQQLVPSGGDVYVADEGMPISWVVDHAGNGTIMFTETEQYVTGRWWAGLSTTDAKQYILIPSEEPGLEGFKIKKTYPEDDPWYWLYVNGTRVATNGRQAANGDNFSEWKYAVWQFLSTDTETTIGEIVNRKSSNGPCFDLTGRTIHHSSVSNHPLPRGIYLRDGKKVVVK